MAHITVINDDADLILRQEHKAFAQSLAGWYWDTLYPVLRARELAGTSPVALYSVNGDFGRKVFFSDGTVWPTSYLPKGEIFGVKIPDTEGAHNIYTQDFEGKPREGPWFVPKDKADPSWLADRFGGENVFVSGQVFEDPNLEKFPTLTPTPTPVVRDPDPILESPNIPQPPNSLSLTTNGLNLDFMGALLLIGVMVSQ